MIKWTFLGIIFASLLWPFSAEGQGRISLSTLCVPVFTAENNLYRRFGEEKVAEGLTSYRNVTTELWRTKDGKTWTFLLRIGAKVLCTLSSGRDWHEVSDKIPIQGFESQ